MSDMTTNWSREEFEAYLLFYAADADFIQTEEERKLILSKVSDSAFAKMNAEFQKDNDYIQIQKIIATAERFELSKEEVNTLLLEVSQLFKADGKVDILEREYFIGLRRILK